MSAGQAEIGVSWRKTTRCSVLECVEVAALPVDPGTLTEADRDELALFLVVGGVVRR